jgi:RimJ/RimL family protein N-acetyltransferase
MILGWRNDWRILEWSRQFDLLNEVEHAAWFEKQAQDPKTRMYKLVLKAQGTTNDIGICGLSSIDYRNSHAEFSLFIAPAYQRRSFGTMALKVLLTHAFTNIGVRMIYGETFEGNPAARLFEKVGLKKDGVRRGFQFKDGKWVDTHLYSITREEWHAILHPGPPAPVDDGKPCDTVIDVEPIKTRRGRKPKLSPVEALCNPPEPDPQGAA